MRAVTPDQGSVTFDDGDGPVDVLAADGAQLMDLRTKIQMIFQDPVSSLSPRMTIGSILSEPRRFTSVATKPTANRKCGC